MPNKLATIRLLELLCEPADSDSITAKHAEEVQPGSPRLCQG
jgi:hypothetical protein